MPSWTVADIPDQKGRTAIITGATGGLGYETALALAAKGGDVILAARNPAKGEDALARIRAAAPDAKIRFELLDLASLTSIKDFAERMAKTLPSLDLLINNAGIMALPKRELTKDGFEAQIGTNYLSHFALTLRLLPLLRKAKHPRVVSLSSIAHRGGRINLDDLQAECYRSWPVYQQSKLAMLIFALELQRRSHAGGWGVTSIAAHPGIARTDLVANGMGEGGLLSLLTTASVSFFGHDAAAGALPTLYAATDPKAEPSGYYGPKGFQEMRGAPAAAQIARHAKDTEMGAKLWAASEKLTGVTAPA